MRYRRLGCPLVCLLALAALASTVRADTPRAERPTYKVGDQWVLKDGVYELTKVDKNGYVFSAAGGRQIVLSQDLAITGVTKGGRTEWDLYPSPAPKWPLEVGKWGMGRGILKNRDQPSGAPVRVTWQVKALEDVRVPAGEFKAYRIEQTMELETGDRLRRTPSLAGRLSWTVITWYAPDARRIVKAEAVGVDALDMQLVSADAPAADVRVVLERPADGAHVTSDRLTVEGRVVSPGGTARLNTTVNGAPVPGWEDRATTAGESTLSIPVTLREGKNVVLVTAVDAAGAPHQAGRIVFYDRPAPASPRAAAAPPPATVTTEGPRVAISAPQDQSRVDHDSVTLAGIVSAARGVQRVVVSVNGAEATRLEERTPPPSLPVNVALRLREGANTVVVTATDADGRVQQDVRGVVYEPVTPLTVQVRNPENQARLAEETTVVAALVTSSKGVSLVTVTLNGKEVFRDAKPVTPRSVVVTAPVKLQEGTNAVVVSAREIDGTVRQDVRTVVYTRAAAAAPAPPALQDRWAVVVGIGRYENSAVPALRFSVADAEAVAQVLVERAGFKKDNVLLLTDRSERKPTLRNLKWALGTFLARSAKKQDLVIIYFAGHGAPEIDPRGIESDGFAKYLVPSDADPNDLYATGLPMDELQTIFDRIEAGRIVVFLDACYSGAAGGRTFASVRSRAAKVDEIFLDRLTRSSGRAIITASRASEVSIELPELGHGIFTHYLLQGLRGTADLDRDGIVSLQELYQYLEQEVSRKSRSANGNQHPVMKGEVDGMLPLVKVGK